MALLTASLVLAGTLAAPPPPAEAPGGYWSVGEQHERARVPKDGDDELTIGSILLSLGLLRLGAAGLNIWMVTQPQFCPQDDPSVDCSGLRIYGWVGLGEGALMLGTGIVYLGLGAHHRRRYRAWKSGEPLSLQLGASGATLAARPWLMLRSMAGQNATNPGFESRSAPSFVGGGLRFQLRF